MTTALVMATVSANDVTWPVAFTIVGVAFAIALFIKWL